MEPGTDESLRQFSSSSELAAPSFRTFFAQLANSASAALERSPTAPSIAAWHLQPSESSSHVRAVAKTFSERTSRKSFVASPAPTFAAGPEPPAGTPKAGAPSPAHDFA